MSPLIAEIEHYLNTVPRRACDTEEVGAFTCYYRRDALIPELSYARPARPLPNKPGLLDEEIQGVRQAFHRQGRTARFEFIAEQVPDFASSLPRNGFQTPQMRPLMVISPDTFRSVSPSSEVTIYRAAAADTRAISLALHIAYGGDAYALNSREATENDFLSESCQQGTVVYGAAVQNEIVGGGAYTPLAGTAEIAGIGVLPAYRGRGIASAITSALVRSAIEEEVKCLFLTAGDGRIAGIYSRIGFWQIGMAVDAVEELQATSV